MERKMHLESFSTVFWRGIYGQRDVTLEVAVYGNDGGYCEEELPAC